MHTTSCRTGSLFLAALLVMVGLAKAAPTLPNINTNNLVTITSAPFNAVGDGLTDNTLAISNAIVIAAAGPATNGLSGGTVRIPAPGVFLTGPLTLKNKVNVQIDAGATLRMLPINLYTNYPPQAGNGQTYGNLFYANALSDLEISGSGTIDGQGAPWWASSGAVFDGRPYMIYFNGGCQRVLVQNITTSNAPAQNIVFKGKGQNLTVQGITQRAPPSSGVINPSHNTDGVDLVGTNILVQNCIIDVGDDNIALGSSAAGTVNILITNCAFGNGHGVSIGSNTKGGVSNLTVIDCTFSGTDNGIRLKSDNGLHGSSVGGPAQNLNYFNIGMTNVGFPFIIYSYYNITGTPNGITPATAAAQTIDIITNTPIWRDITISNLTATSAGNFVAGIIWGRTELAVSNVVFNHVKITAARTFDIYNARGIQFIDSQITSTGKTFTIWNADVICSNSAPAAPISFDGLASTSALALYNAPASMSSTDLFGINPLSLRGSTLANTGNLTLPGSSVINLDLGTNGSAVAVAGNLNLNSTLNFTNAGGFTSGNYILFTYTGTLSGSPTLGLTPSLHYYTYSLDTSTVGQIKLIVTPPAPPVFGSSALTGGGTSLVMSGSGGVTNGAYYVLTATNVSLPLSQWSPLATNQFNASGNFNFSDTIIPGSPQRFYLLQIP
jgi:polygalacturonase